ncbi:MAG: hypothetical protein KGQ41_04965 [Alphaproteobacteria bacterium]|nr:hypothetical protein [Alphaproteobacteria bacterium]
MLQALKTSKHKWPLRIGAVFGLSALTYLTVVPVGPNSFGLKLTFNNVSATDLPSGVYFKVPLVQQLYTYTRGPITLEYSAGGCRTYLCDTTADHAALYARLRIQYTIQPNHIGLAMRPLTNYGIIMPDGWWEMTDTLNASGSAVLGRRTMQENMAAFEAVATELKADIEDRLRQNNSPFKVENFELLGFRTVLPTSTNAYRHTP